MDFPRSIDYLERKIKMVSVKWSYSLCVFFLSVKRRQSNQFVVLYSFLCCIIASEIKSLPKSTATLSRSTTNLDTSSQQNKIVPLVAASTNAPFEQTFRITVCLPLDQLYVARVGAKTKLVNLLEMVCTNKLLDKEKFEFRHPSEF